MTSVRNFPVQANSASITRLAVVDAWKEGLTVMCSLHDALYLISTSPEEDSKKLEKIMINATAKVLNQKVEDCTIRIDFKTISHEDTWIEEKGEKDWVELQRLFA
jgi:dihydroxyacetone kinase-like predicted kinase